MIQELQLKSKQSVTDGGGSRVYFVPYCSTNFLVVYCVYRGAVFVGGIVWYQRECCGNRQSNIYLKASPRFWCPIELQINIPQTYSRMI